jgi:hypothetical protein
MRGARWIYVVLGVALLAGLFFLLRPGDDEPASGTSPSPTASPTESPTDGATTQGPQPSPTATGPDAVEVEVEVEEGRIELQVEEQRQQVPGRVVVNQGEPVSIKLEADSAAEVHVHGYDLFVNVLEGGERTIQFPASAPGVFEVELEDTHQLIFELEVRP